MLKRLFLFLIIIAIILVWLGGIFLVTLRPFSFSVNKPEKDFLKRVARKVKNIIYREATVHNPEGDLIPDQIDDEIKQKVKETF